jgi:phytoene dehydrogenase-like protein
MKQYKTIVVGGGIAGLTAAVYTAKRFGDVLLVEQNERTGGLVNTFTKDGFTFDGGVRALESAGIIKPMLADLGIDLTYKKNKVSVGIANDVIHVETESDLTVYMELLRRIYPDSGDDLVRLEKLIKKVMNNMKILYAVDNPLFMNFKEDLPYFVRVYLPWMFKFMLALRNIKKLNGPVEEALASIINNRSLRDIVDQHFFKATPAFFAMSYFYLYTDYFYPSGGVGVLPGKMQDKFGDLGGKLQLNTKIVKLKPAQKTIIDSQGIDYAYEKLIWAADLKTLFSITDGDGLPRDQVEKIEAQKRLILSRRAAESIFTVFAGVDLPPEFFASISQGHFFYTPSPRGLGEIHRSELRSMLNEWERIEKSRVLSWIDKFCTYNTYEISIPVLKDPGSAPPGRTGIIASLLFEYKLVKLVKDDGWYEEFKTYLENKIIEVLSESIYPGLDRHILFKFSASPLSIEEKVGSSEGAIIGWSFEDPVPVSSSMLGINEAVKTPIPHVFKAGQWAYSPTGVPTAILTGRLAADAVVASM